MSSCIRQGVWLSFVLVVWCFQGGAVRAGYVTVAATGGDEAGRTLSSALITEEHDTGTAMAEAGAWTWQRSDDGDSHAPTKPSCPFGTLLLAFCNFGHGGGAGSSSGSGSGNAPSGPPLGDVSRPQVPPLELASLLPPHPGDAHPFSVASFLFRPPR